MTPPQRNMWVGESSPLVKMFPGHIEIIFAGNLMIFEKKKARTEGSLRGGGGFGSGTVFFWERFFDKIQKIFFGPKILRNQFFAKRRKVSAIFIYFAQPVKWCSVCSSQWIFLSLLSQSVRMHLQEELHSGGCDEPLGFPPVFKKKTPPLFPWRPKIPLFRVKYKNGTKYREGIWVFIFKRKIIKMIWGLYSQISINFSQKLAISWKLIVCN